MTPDQESPLVEEHRKRTYRTTRCSNTDHYDPTAPRQAMYLDYFVSDLPGRSQLVNGPGVGPVPRSEWMPLRAR